MHEHFLAWFGRSKAVDRTGAPLRLFHGTCASFDVFDPLMANTNTKTGTPQGAFVFSSCPEVASSYAGQKTRELGFVREEDEKHYRGLLVKGEIDEAIVFSSRFGTPGLKTYRDGGNVMPVYLKILKPLRINARGESWSRIYLDRDEWTTNELMELAMSQGRDGLIIKNVLDRQEGKGAASDVYVVFSPSQIKSALGNSGRYSHSPSLTDAFDDDLALRAQQAVRALEALSALPSPSPSHRQDRRTSGQMALFA